jgi:hypothetical protein
LGRGNAHQTYQSLSKSKPSTTRLLPPIFDLGEPFPGFASAGEPALAGLGEGQEYPAPGLAIALVDAAHLLQKLGEFFGSGVFVPRAVFARTFDQVFGEYPTRVLRAWVWKFADAEEMGVPLLKAVSRSRFHPLLGFAQFIEFVPQMRWFGAFE